MAFVTLLHPEETFTIPILQAINKCSLFQNNPTLLSSPYQIQSSVSLSIFREFFLSALDGKAINIRDTNFTELQQLCEEFGFTELSAKLSDFRSSMDFKVTKADQPGQIRSWFSGVRSAQLSDSIEFIVNGTVIESDILEAASLSPFFREQLSVDGCARKFILNDNRISATDIRSLQLLL
jgi:hypothetical protein